MKIQIPINLFEIRDGSPKPNDKSRVIRIIKAMSENLVLSDTNCEIARDIKNEIKTIVL